MQPRSLSARTLLAAAALTLGGCVTTTPEDAPAQSVLIANSGSFDAAMRGVERVALHPRARIVKPRPTTSEATVRGEMDRAIALALARRGIQLVTPGGGEQRLIAYAIGIEGELDDEAMFELFGISPGVDGAPGELRGGIVMVAVHPHTDAVLWRGSGSGPGDPEPGQTRSQQIEGAVERVLTGR